MGDFTNAILNREQLAHASKARTFHPTGWEPGVDTAKGEITIRQDQPPVDNVIDWSDWLQSFGFDPDQFTIEDDRIEVRTWDAVIADGAVTRFWYYKARIVKRRTRPDLDALKAEIRKHRPTKPDPVDTATALVVVNTDWQLGKRDGDGTDGIIQRVLASIGAVSERIRATNPSRLIVANLGDLIEGCTGHYPMQEFQVELDRREQTTIARRLLLKQLQQWTRQVPEILVVAVPGNHGEHRKSGKAFTTFGDNDDLAVVEQVGEILGENPDRYGHVRFMVPTNELTVTADVYGTVVGFAHSHQANRSAGRDGLAHTKTWAWWRQQSHARTPIGDADILVTGHFHYLSVIENGDRTHIQAPPLDGGSDWYQSARGYGTKPGVLSFTVNEHGWDRLRVM